MNFNDTTIRIAVKEYLKDNIKAEKKYGCITFWNTSNVTNMSGMFYNARNFNQPLQWITINVTNMSYMFYNARNFNQLLLWDTSKVTNMTGMFRDAINFNQPLYSNNKHIYCYNTFKNTKIYET